MAAIGKVSIELEAKMAKLETDVGRAARLMEREMARMSSRITGELSKVNQKAEETGKVLRKAFDIVIAADVARKLRKMVDDYANLSARVRLASGANANFTASLQAVKKVAIDTYASLTATTGLIQKISQSLQNTGMSASASFSQAIKLTEVFNKSLVVSGAGTIQAEAAMLQFSQAIAKGKLDGDEFRSVMENNSRFMLLLADSIGVTFAELYRLREAGLLTNDMLMKVTENTARLDKEFASFPITIGRAFTNLNTAMTTFVGGMDAATGASRTLGEALNFVAKNFDAIANVAVGAGVIALLTKGLTMMGSAATAAGAAIGKVAAANQLWKGMQAAGLAAAQASAAAAQAKTVEIARTLEVIQIARAEATAKLKAAQEIIAGNRALLMSEQQLAIQRSTFAATQGNNLSYAIKINRDAAQAIAFHEAALRSITSAQQAQIAQTGILATLGKAEANTRIQLAGAASAQLVSMMALNGAQASAMKSAGLLATAWTGLKAAGAGLLAIIGGWPTLIAAAAYGTYLWINAETDAQEAAKATESALGDLISATNEYEKAQKSAALAQSYSEQVKSVEELRAAMEKAVAVSQAMSDAGMSDINIGFAIAAAEARNTTAAFNEANKSLADITGSILEFKGVKVDYAFAVISDMVNAGINPLKAWRMAMDDARVAGQDFSVSSKDFIKDLEDQRDKLRETNAELKGGVAAVLAMKVAQIDWLKAIKNGDAGKIQALIRDVISLTNENEGLTAATRNQAKADKAAEKSAEELRKERERLDEAIKNNGRAARALAAGALGELAEIENDMLQKIEEWQDKLAKGETTLADYATAVRALAAARIVDEDAARAQIAADEAAADIVGRATQYYQEEAGALYLTGRAAFVYEAALRAAADANIPLAALADDVRKSVEGQAGAFYDASMVARNYMEQVQKGEDRAIQAAHGVADAFGEMVGDIATGRKSIVDGFHDFGDSLVDIVADSVAQMISEFAKLQIINPILNSIFNGFGGNLLPTGQGGGILGSVLGGAGGSGNLLGNLGGAFSSGVGGLLSSVGGFFSQGAAFQGAGMMGSLGNFGSGMATAGANVSGMGFFGSMGSNIAGGFGSMASGSIAAGLGQLIPVIGQIAAIAMTINSISGGRLFGTSYRQESGTTSLSLGDDGGTATQTARDVRQRSLFRGRQWRTRNIDPSSEAVDAAQELFDSISEVMATSARTLMGEAPAMIDAALRTVTEYDKDGKIKATKYFVDAIGRSWEEATAEAAATRISAEAIIATIDSILGTAGEAAAQSAAGVVEAVIGGAADAIGDAGSSAFDTLIRKVEGTQGEASAIAERWRDDAETLMDGAQFLLMAASDIRAGAGLLGEGTLTEITALIEDMQQAGESLSETYTRVALSTALFEEAIDLSGVTIDLAREEFVRFASEIADSAGGIERAQALWSAYFENFYSDSERAARSSGIARANATREFGDIGMDVKPFLDEGGADAFRQMFEDVLPTLSADAIVQWLEAANSLGVLIDATETLGEVSDNSAQAMREGLSAIMTDVMDQIAELSPPASFEERMQAIVRETASLIAQAEAMGGGEKEFTRIRELGLIRQNALIQEQAELLAAQDEAAANLTTYLARLQAMSGSAGISPLTDQLMSLRAEYQAHIEEINNLAIASGRAGASQEELAIATDWYAAQLRRVAEELMSSAASLVQRLYGAATGTSTSTGGGGFSTGYGGDGGPGEVAAAVEDRYAREMELLKNLREYLESLGLSNLSPLTPAEQLQEAQSQYQEILARAMGGDLDALGQLQGAANTYLGQAQSYYGGVGAYGGIFDSVQSQIQGLLDRGPLNSPTEPAPIVVTGPGGGGILVDPGEGFQQLSEIERMAIANELATVLRDLIALTGQSLIDVADSLGLDLRDLVHDLGVNLDDLTVATTNQLADISRQLGVDLVDLASGVGVSLGALADEQSLMNDALEQTIDSLPGEFRDRLRGYLEAIEDATTEADANEAIAEAEAAINLLPADIRDALAPFFTGVSSPSSSLLNEVIAQSGILLESRGALGDIAATLLRIEALTGPATPGPGTGIGPWPLGPTADAMIEMASTSAVLATIDSAMLSTDDVDSAQASQDTLSQIKSELVAIKAAITASGKDNASATTAVEKAIKTLPIGGARRA